MASRRLQDHDACGVGFIARLGAPPSREVVERALMALQRLNHRGGVDSDGCSGDGAGLLTELPFAFFRRCAAADGIHLPSRFAVGMLFLPRDATLPAMESVETAARETGLRFLGWRDVPLNPEHLGPRSAATLPCIRQCFVAPAHTGAPHDEHGTADFELALFFARKRIECSAPEGTYVCSLSERTIIYKGLLVPWQLPAAFHDLAERDFVSRFAIFHQRYSTNTSPSWRLAQPFRLSAHNGEINTIGANRRWLRAREAELRREFNAGGWFHALERDVSDSASFDNALELVVRQGYSLAEALCRLTPPAWEHDETLTPGLRALLQSAAREQEPWDGPAALIFSDGRYVGARLDRNGLRPLRYTLTADGLVVVASETGVADLSGSKIIARNRLGPGEMLLAEPATGEFYHPHDVVRLLNVEEREFVPLRRIGSGDACGNGHRAELESAAPALERAIQFGFTQDQFKLLFKPLVESGKESTFSMGDDAPPAMISSQRRLLWDYCKQRFAQVTNPPIDSLRESQVMSLAVYLGAAPCVFDSPLIDDAELAEFGGCSGMQAVAIDVCFEPVGDREAAIDAGVRALERIRDEAAAAVIGASSDQLRYVVLSDKDVSATRCALPILLAIAAAWRGMLDAGGHRVPLIVETGQVWDTHHLAMCVAVGASAVKPYLAWQFADTIDSGRQNYRTGVLAGLRKVLAKMGISTVASYRNGRLFETLGLDREVSEQFFDGAAAYLSGKSLSSLIEDCLCRHEEAYANHAPASATPALTRSQDDCAPSEAAASAHTAGLINVNALRDAGLYRFRHGGEQHSTSPDVIRRFHAFARTPTPENYRLYASYLSQRQAVSLRDLVDFRRGGQRSNGTPPLDNVEPQSRILSRFSTQAMSLGAISPEAHRVLAIAMNRLGARSNTGEGGEDAEIYLFDPEANNRVKQVASARFGVNANYLVHADELEIKMAQGSKPGEGGQLPPGKVSPYIARLRHAVPGMALISPPPHHDIYSIEDLAQLIHDLKAINPRARIGVKLVSGAGVGIIAAGVAKAGANVITISGYDGGTGASPLSSIKNTGLPWEIGLRDAHTTLVGCGFRSRVRLRVDGGFKSGRDVVLAAILGADEYGFATSALVAVGCIMARQCHLNTCPVGIATQDERLRQKFTGTPEMAMAYFRHVAEETRELLAEIGAESLDKIIGRVELLQARSEAGESLIRELIDPVPAADHQLRVIFSERPTLQQRLVELLDRAERTGHVHSVLPISNGDRSVGARLSGEILRRFGGEGLPRRTFDYEFRGSAGQSFGAFLAHGLRFRLEGDANDYVGKGLSGGEIVITAGADSSRRGDVLIGNTALYGATAGELYVAGRAGERFAVRNSGALAVVEGTGQHACEYMTAGVVIVLGPTGANFGSGMTGGLAYVLRDTLPQLRLNEEYVQLAALTDWEEDALRNVIENHYKFTGSHRAWRVLSAAGRLPLVRVQPLSLPCSIEETWGSFTASTPEVPISTQIPGELRAAIG